MNFENMHPISSIYLYLSGSGSKYAISILIKSIGLSGVTNGANGALGYTRLDLHF